MSLGKQLQFLIKFILYKQLYFLRKMQFVNTQRNFYSFFLIQATAPIYKKIILPQFLYLILKCNTFSIFNLIIQSLSYLGFVNAFLTIIIMKTIEGYTYKVNQHIGKGYSSTVHKGVNDKNGQQVSIKVIEMAKLQDPINQMLLQLEVTALRSLANTPHVLHLYDVYATKNNTYLITELCEGDLSSMLKQKKTFSYLQAVQIMRQLIKGYHDIHSAGFVHRDIKPANIFHKNGVYKYGDFGFSIPISEIPAHKHYNVGSPVYMPPEALKQNIYSVSCDVWALGIIFYQLLKGVVPWRALSEQVLYQKIMNEPLDVLTQGLPQPARKFLALVLNIDIKQRPSPDQILHWPNQLQNISNEIRHLSPFDQRGRTINPLRELACNTTNQNKVNFNHTTNIANYCSQNKNTNAMLSSKAQQSKLHAGHQSPREDCVFKEAYFFANNSINYVKFLHRVLKFLLPPSSIDLGQISNSIKKLMFKELNIIKNLAQGQGNFPRISEWNDFLRSPKMQVIRKKIKKYEVKYTMFHENPTESPDIQNTKVLQTINVLINYMDIEGYVPKMVVAADYLTTLYQLLHLRDKYESQDFMKLSKIDLIMQGNPYNTSPQHLPKLKKKLLLIRP